MPDWGPLACGDDCPWAFLDGEMWVGGAGRMGRLLPRSSEGVCGLRRREMSRPEKGPLACCCEFCLSLPLT